MPVLRRIEITNFRGIRRLTWRPGPGLNCLVGHGDTGKTTVLDAIELVLGPARRYQTFSDADFYRARTKEEILIQAVIGGLPPELMEIERFGRFLCGYREGQEGLEEPDEDGGLETVLVRRFELGAGLEPRWRLWSGREPDSDTDIPWKLRETIAPARLGTYTAGDLAFGARSVLGRMAGPDFTGAEALAAAAKAARLGSGAKLQEALGAVVATVQKTAEEMNVPATGVQALIDAHAAAIAQSGVALHDGDQIPLRALGAGSSRLLVAALQVASSQGRACLVDEVEHGLEPYRIVRLLHALGAKHGGAGPQVFLTTHSPVVLRELRSDQLFLVRRTGADPEGEASSHEVNGLGGEDEQKAVRACPEAFLAPAVVVCEGKTEIGFLRGLSRYWESQGQPGIGSLGVCPADGGGTTMFARALVFARLGFRTALFLDGDKREQGAEAKGCRDAGVEVHRWSEGRSIEQEIFACAPPELYPALLQIAIDRCGESSVNDRIASARAGAKLDDCRKHPEPGMAEPLGVAAKKGGWFKDIDPAEQVALEAVAPNLGDFREPVQRMVESLRGWCNRGPAAPEEVAPAAPVAG